LAEGEVDSQKALANVFANPAQNVVLGRCRLVYFLPAVWQVDNPGQIPWDYDGTDSEGPSMTPEQQPRQNIDAQLFASGWLAQDYTKMDLSAGRGIALRQVPLKSERCDYDNIPAKVISSSVETTPPHLGRWTEGVG